MQVATLFRETANLLGASMESASSNGGVSTGSCSPPTGLNTTQQPHRDPIYTRPMHERYKPMSNENQDDGYETSADLVLNNGGMNHQVSNMDHLEDPYSFVDDDHQSDKNRNLMQISHPHQQIHSNYLSPPNNMLMDPNSMMPSPRKRGRKKKIKVDEDGNITTIIKLEKPAKERKKHDRFNGMPEEEVSKRTLPDHLTQNLDIIIIGINPGLFAAYKGHHYAGPGNHFWKCLYLSGLTPEQMSADEDYKLLQVGIGFTNMVQRATKGSADLTRKEIKEGSQILLEKLQHFKPKIAVFNGKLIYEVFSGKKDFCFGRQPDLVDGTNTYMWVMPSSSARCAQLPRAADKVPFYAALKKFRDYLNGMVAMIDESEVVFSEARIKSSFESDVRNQNSNDFIDLSNTIGKHDEDSIVPCKKKRGRPKKIKVEGEEPVKIPTVKRIYNPTTNLNADGTKKKRGRPKKIRLEDGGMMEPLPLNSDQQKPSVMIHDISPEQTSNDYCHLQPQQQATQQMYNLSNTPTPSMQHLPPYIQSPRPQSQPFTHSDLSSEISAAISSEHLESPAPTSPSLDAPDFDPPTNMPTEDTTECCFSSPTPSTTSEQQTPPMIRPLPYSAYNNYNSSPDPNTNTNAHNNTNAIIKPEYKVQDMSTKSLSGLESLVDQIPNITDSSDTNNGGQTNGSIPTSVNNNTANTLEEHHQQQQQHHHHHSQSYHHDTTVSNSPSTLGGAPTSTTSSLNFNYPTNPAGLAPLSNSPSGPAAFHSFTSNYPTNNYTNLMGVPGGMHSFMEHHNCGMPAVPVPLSYHQLPPPYGQQYSSSYGAGTVLHMPSPNYPNGYGGYTSGYGSAVPSPPTATYHHHMFDRLKPDTGGYPTF